VLDVEIDRDVTPPDFEILAAVWLEGCELPEAEEVEERPKEKVPVVATS